MNGRFSRTFLLVAGIITVAVILCSQSLYQPVVSSTTAKAKNEQKADPHQKFVSVAPSDMVPSPAVQLDKITVDLLTIFTPRENVAASFQPVRRMVVSFVQTLLRAAISPNAP